MRWVRTSRVRSAVIGASLCVSLVACDETSRTTPAAADLDPTTAQALESADFCSYVTFDFLDIELLVPPEDGADDVALETKPAAVLESETPLREAIADVLVELGLERAPEAELAVSLFYRLDDEPDEGVDEPCFAAEECCWYGLWFGYACDWLTVVEYEPGTVVIDVVDTKLDTVVFRGALHGILGGPDLEERIHRAVTKVFEEYPTAVEPCP